MLKNASRFISLVLALLMVTASFTGCKSKPGTTTSKATTIQPRTTSRVTISGTASRTTSSVTAATGADTKTPVEIPDQGNDPIDPIDPDVPADKDITDGTRQIDLQGQTILFATWGPLAAGENPVYNKYNIAQAEDERLASIKIARYTQAEQLFNCKFSFYFEGYGTYRNSLTNATLAGIKFADYFAVPTRDAFPNWVKGKILQPLDAYFNFKDGAFAVPSSAVTMFNGKHYGIIPGPVSFQTRNIAYSRRILEQSGSPDPYDLMVNGQWNWDTLLEAAQYATRDFNGDGVTDQWGISPRDYWQFASGLLFSNGGHYITSDGTSFTYAMDTPNVIRALQFAGDLIHVYKVTKYPPDNPTPRYLWDGLAAFEAYASFGNAPGNAQYDNALVEQRLGYVFFPKGPDIDRYISPIVADGFYAIPTTVANTADIAYIMAYVLGIWNDKIEPYISWNDLVILISKPWANQSKDLFLRAQDLLEYIPEGLNADMQPRVDWPNSTSVFGRFFNNNIPVGTVIAEARTVIQDILNSWTQ